MASSVVYLGLALIILIISFAAQVDSYLNRYISVISDVHQYYGTLSVFFHIISRNNRCFEDYTSVYSLSRDFSRKYDYTSITYLDQVDERMILQRKRKGRYLRVIFLQSLSDIAEFTHTIKSHIWLVIFTNKSDRSEVCEYCKSPMGNRFRLRFNSEMLVLCCDSLILEDWWSIDGDHTEVSDFASWTDENRDKITFLAPATLYDRRYEVKGAGIRIGLVESSEFAYEVGDKIQGFFGDILAELKRSMNFTITGIVSSPGYGNWDPETKSWKGTIGRLVKGEIDLGVSDFTITNTRLAILEYTLPLAGIKKKLYIRDKAKSDVGVIWTAYFKPFSVNIWISMTLLITLASTLLAVIKLHKSSRSSRTIRGLPPLIVESYVEVWGIFCQQGLHDFSAETSLRIAYFSIFIMALIIYTTYAGLLISFLTSSSTITHSPFTTLEGFVKDGSYRLIVYRNHAEYEFLADTTIPVLKQMMKLMKPMEELPETIAAGWEQVCQENVALYTDDISTSRCKITAIDSGYKDSMAMIMPIGSQYSKVVNYHIQRFRDNGVIDRIKHKYYNSTYTSVEATFIDVDLWDVAPVLTILTIGLILALVLLSAEAMYYALEISNLRSERRQKNCRNFWRKKSIREQFTRGKPPYDRVSVNEWIIPTNYYK